jgi:hypothetical protein
LAWLALVLGLLVMPGVNRAGAAPLLGSWKPLFQGIDLAQGTNAPGGTMPNLHVAYVLRVNLTEPGVRLLPSPPIDDAVLGAVETEGYTVSDYLAKHRLQVAVNAALFDPEEYYLPAGTRMDIAGFSVSEGRVVSTQESADNAATMVFTEANVASVIPTNWPPVSAAGIFTAVSGSYPILVNHVNLGSLYANDRDFIHRTNPRTVFGITPDGRTLYLVAIDGRQAGYSIGANDFESASWLAFLGCSDGVNMDGGGSTTMVIEDSTGVPLRLNRSSAVADSGRERTVGSHFGIYANPLRGFVNDVRVAADDISARISWTTVSPATGLVRYGLSSDLGQEVASGGAGTTEHSVLLSGLTPGTRYYFSAVSESGGVVNTSSLRVFSTSNFVSEASLFGVTKEWRYSTAEQGGTAWTTRDFDDSGWEGPGPGLLWVDSRGAARTGVEPANTRMPTDPSSGGFPYPTYYFRTRFQFDGPVAGVTLVLTNYLDDGAVFYLNGGEIGRLRMEEAPAPIGNADLAIGFGCSGDATCPEVLSVSGGGAGRLVTGENVLAVEVHNYNARSPDITFGMALGYTAPIVVRPALRIRSDTGGLALEWDRPGFVVQEAMDAGGPWVDVAGPLETSPARVAVGSGVKFYRLRQK